MGNSGVVIRSCPVTTALIVVSATNRDGLSISPSCDPVNLKNEETRRWFAGFRERCAVDESATSFYFSPFPETIAWLSEFAQERAGGETLCRLQSKRCWKHSDQVAVNPTKKALATSADVRLMTIADLHFPSVLATMAGY